MAETHNNAESVAEVYARSLLELATEKGGVDEIAEEFASLIATMNGDETFGRFMTSATIDPDDRGESLEKLFRGKMNDLLLGTLQVINARRRSEILPSVYQLYRHLVAERQGRIEIEVTSAEPLDATLAQRLRTQLSAYTGKDVVLLPEVDPEILGGLVIRIGDRQIDSSLRRKLQRLRADFSERAGKEIHATTAEST